MTEPVNPYIHKTLSELRELKSQISSDAHSLATWVKALGTKGESEDVQLLLPCLKHSDGRVRANSIEALEILYHKIKEPKILSIFANFLTDTEPRVVSACIKALSTKISRTELRALVDKVYNPLEPRRCLSVLYLIRHLKLDDCLDMVDMMLSNQSLEIQREAQKVLDFFLAIEEELKAKEEQKSQEKRRNFELQTGNPSQDTLRWLMDDNRLDEFCKTWEPDFDQIKTLEWLIQNNLHQKTPLLLCLFETVKRLPNHELEIMRQILGPLLTHPDLCYPCVEFLQSLGGDEAYQLAIKRQLQPNLGDAREKELYLGVTLQWHQSNPEEVEAFVQKILNGGRNGIILLSGMYARLSQGSFSETLWEIGFSHWKSLDEYPLFSLLSQGLIHYSPPEKRLILSQIAQKLPETKRSLIIKLLKDTPLPNMPDQAPIPQNSKPAKTVTIPAIKPPKHRKWLYPAFISGSVASVFLIVALNYSKATPSPVISASAALPRFQTGQTATSVIIHKGEGLIESIPAENMLRVKTKNSSQILILPDKVSFPPSVGQKIRYYGEWQEDTEHILVKKVFLAKS